MSVLAETNPVFHHYTTEDGLFHNEIRLIRKAHDGMLWLGTQNGLSSFDGYRFTVYKHNDNVPNSICSDKIYALETSATGNIWVGTTTGLCVLNPITNKASSFRDTFAISTNFENDNIHNLFEDRSGYLWISCSSGNYRYSVYNHTLEKFFAGKSVKSFYESSEGSFWICHDGEVSKYGRDSGKILECYSTDIDKLYNDRFGVLWGVGSAGLYRFMPGEARFELLSHVAHPLKTGFECIAEDREGNLFLGSYGGAITIYSPTTDEAKYLLANPSLQSGISSNDVYDIYGDEAGVVWVGTQEGLDVYDWSRQRFIKWKFEPDNPVGLSNSFIQTIYRDKNGFLWLGTRDRGLEKLKKGSSLYNPQFEHYPAKLDNSGIAGNYVACVLHDSRDRFWVASWGGGLSLKEKESDRWIRFRRNTESGNTIAGNSVISVIEDRRGRILVGTLSGLSVITKSGNNSFIFTNYFPENGNEKSISQKDIFKVFEDSKGRIWVGMNNGGLDLMHEEMDGSVWFEHFRHNAEDPTSISNDEVFVIFEDSKQRLWVGTSFAGFNRVIETVDEKGKSTFSFKSYKEKDGLGDNEVNAILEDDFGSLWISTNKGLSCFNPEDETFINYSEYDGVLKGKFRKNAAWKDEDGTIYFGGAAGVNVFNPTRFPKNTTPPKPAITAVLIDNNKLYEGELLKEVKGLSRNKEGSMLLRLTESLNRFEMWLTAMSFTSANRNKYAWKLEGIDTDWNFYEGNNPRLNYSDLPPGDYQLVIKAANNDGVWNTTPLTVRIQVKKEGNISILLLAFAFLAVGAVITFFVRNRKTEANYPAKKQSTFSKEDYELVDRLNQLMQDKQPYLDFKLSLGDLAKCLGISANQLSALLNDVAEKTFYDYVNEFRINEVKKRLVDPKHQKKTILSIAWECGFNSKSAFNRIFKTSTGMTPSEYQKKYLQR